MEAGGGIGRSPENRSDMQELKATVNCPWKRHAHSLEWALPPRHPAYPRIAEVVLRVYHRALEIVGDRDAGDRARHYTQPPLHARGCDVIENRR